MGQPVLKHAMTIDVEDYFHVAAFSRVIEQKQWDDYKPRVVANTERILDLFERKDLKATFFVLGWVAERFPELVKSIDEKGHEIASHGYSHQLVYSQTPEVFREETKKSKDILENIIQRPIEGYRAASYSITRQSIWALDILAELGFTWDSSIFPIRHDTYGMPGSPEEPYIIKTSSGAELFEIPLSTASVGGLNIPAAGGGYFRQFPYFVFKWLFHRASNAQTKPIIFYLHPWEIDVDQPRVENAGWLSKFRHYTNLKRCYGRLERVIDDFPFGTVSESGRTVTVNKTISIKDL